MNFILTSDFHLCDDVPRCRLETQEEWYDTQRYTLSQIVNKANEVSAPLYITGDVFDKPTCSMRLLNIAQETLSMVVKGTFILIGNHDVQFHSLSNLPNSAIGVLLNSSNIFRMSECVHPAEWGFHAYDFGTQPEEGGDTLMFMHLLVLEEKIPIIQAISAHELAEKYEYADWMFVGDNHRSFHVRIDKRSVVNPGTIIRRTADLRNYKPGFCLVDTDADSVDWFDLEEREDMFTDDYIVDVKEDKDRLAQIVSSLKDQEGLTLDFRANCLEALKKNKQLMLKTRQYIQELLEV
jgi:DNA repair exonuclease SbcCD nuclease subunit